MLSENQLADYWLTQSEKLDAFILFEGGAFSKEMLRFMMEYYENRKFALYQCPNLKKVAAYGPWLVRIENVKDLAMIFTERLPIVGIIFSALPLVQLASRLTIGCMAKTPDDREILLRYYIPRVLKQLAARPEMKWHSVLFSQIESWWIPEDEKWQRLNISASQEDNREMIENILTLDETLWQEIADRSDVSALLREWRMMKSSHHFPSCAQRKKVENALNKAREIGLTKPLDQKIYALSYLNGKKEYLESAEFEAVLEKAKRNEISLSNVGRD